LTAHTILSKVVDEFLITDRRTPAQKENPKENEVPFPKLKEYLQQYQDPAQASSITAIQQQLDETKIILHKTIDSVSRVSQSYNTTIPGLRCANMETDVGPPTRREDR
jgi:synaptobrevin homolog YKT6